MPSPPSRSGSPLFHRTPHLCSVPSGNLAAAVRSGGPERPVGPCTSASPRTDVRTKARWRIVGATVRGAVFVTTLAMMTNVAAMAQTAPLVAPSQYHAINDPIMGFIADASRRFGLPTTWIRAVMQAESAGYVHAVSPKGAMGLMQLMPETWRELRARYGLGTDPFDPHDNVFAGAAYLRELHDRYGSPGFLAAYHAGPGRYDEYLATGRPLPIETNAYLAAVRSAMDERLPNDKSAVADPLAWRQAPLFVARSQAAAASSATSGQRSVVGRQSPPGAFGMSALAAQSDGLFVPRASRSR